MSKKQCKQDELARKHLLKLSKAIDVLYEKAMSCPYKKHMDWYTWIEDPNNGLTEEQREEQFDRWYEEGLRLHPHLA